MFNLSHIHFPKSLKVEKISFSVLKSSMRQVNCRGLFLKLCKCMLWEDLYETCYLYTQESLRYYCHLLCDSRHSQKALMSHVKHKWRCSRTGEWFIGIALCLPSAALFALFLTGKKAIVKSKPAACKGFLGLKLQQPSSQVSWFVLCFKLSSFP